MDKDLLADVGRALYGEQWQTAIAKDVGVADRTVRRWVAGTADIPAGVAAELLAAARGRVAVLSRVVKRLERAVDEG